MRRGEKGKRERETGKDEQSMSEHCTAFRELRIDSRGAAQASINPLINELISKSGTIQ